MLYREKRGGERRGKIEEMNPFERPSVCVCRQDVIFIVAILLVCDILAARLK